MEKFWQGTSLQTEAAPVSQYHDDHLLLSLPRKSTKCIQMLHLLLVVSMKSRYCQHLINTFSVRLGNSACNCILWILGHPAASTPSKKSHLQNFVVPPPPPAPHFAVPPPPAAARHAAARHGGAAAAALGGCWRRGRCRRADSSKGNDGKGELMFYSWTI